MRKFVYISLTIVISIGFILLGYFTFCSSYLRLKEAFIDLYGSLQYYFRMIFLKPISKTPNVKDYSEVVVWNGILPSDFNKFKIGSTTYIKAFLSKDNFMAWLNHMGDKSISLAKVLTLVLPCIIALIFIIKRLYANCNTRHNKDTIPLKIYKFVLRVTYYPIKRFVKGYFGFLKSHSWIWKCWITLWVFHLNLASIIIAFFAYYFYFAISFDVASLYVQVVKLVLDLQTFFSFFPWWILVFVAYALFERFRKKLAINKLRHYEARNCGFINELPIVSITCGSMGKRKTTMITDMSLSQEVMFRQKAFESLQKADMQFPHFPWICFEREILKYMDSGMLYNLAMIKQWVASKKQEFEEENYINAVYGYDFNKYGLYYDDGITNKYLFDVMETYALSYFIYVMETSLIVANYSIRTDNVLISEGNFPLWNTSFFSDVKRKSRHSHILDFDVLRLGKKVLENNPYVGSFEFGVVAITEIGKERGNNLELKDVKKKNEETNQKNDLFNSWLKMCRHSATVDNYPFIKVFTDEQRPESWGADARDLCDIVNIVSAGKIRLALPFYTIEEMLSEMAFKRFIALYYDFRYRRGDNTLLVHILKSITSFLWKRNARIYNKYGYSILKIEKERGTMDGKPENKKYYLINKKIYSNRFSTDCFSDYFNDMAKDARVGLMDYIEYATEKASVEELKMQNSYFINSLYKCNEEDSAT